MEISLLTAINKLSYGRVGINLLIQLQKLGVKVNLIPIGEIETDKKQEKSVVDWALENTKTISLDAPVIKLWHQHDLSIPSQLIGRRFGFPIFELDSFTAQEKEQLSSVDIINCSKWAEEICHKNGLTNTTGIVRLGYDPAIFFPVESPKNDLFTVLNYSKAEIRKGHDVIPDIFSLAFSSEDKVQLVMCWGNPFYSEAETNSWIRFYKNKLKNYTIDYLDRLDSQEDIVKLIRKSDVGLFPSRAEGWNLPMLEMMACGKPCVSTYYSAHTEFVDEELSVKPDGLELAIDGKWFFAQGQWASLSKNNIESMANKLRKLYDNWLENKTIKVKDVSKFTWENSSKQLLEIVND